MTAVSNTGPLIALAGIGRLDLLCGIFGTVMISEIVRNEFQAGAFKMAGASEIHGADWIQVATSDQPRDAVLESLLDAGEAATISLARQISADVAIIDESKARKIAREIYGLNVVGTGRILVEAKSRGLIAEVRPLISRIRDNGYWLSDKLVAEIVRQARE